MKQLINLFSQGGIVMLLIAGVSVIAWWLAFKTWRTAKVILNNLEHKSPKKENKIIFFLNIGLLAEKYEMLRYIKPNYC